jgi:hypothetical protein
MENYRVTINISRALETISKQLRSLYTRPTGFVLPYGGPDAQQRTYLETYRETCSLVGAYSTVVAVAQARQRN